MKKLKMFSVVFGVMLSVVGVFAKTSSSTALGVRVSDCTTEESVPDDCDSNHGGQNCQVSFINIAEIGNCSAVLRRTN